MTVPSKVTAAKTRIERKVRGVHDATITFYLLTLFITNISGHFHCVTYEGISACVMYRTLNYSLMDDNVNSQSGTLSEGSEFVIDRFGLDGIEGNKCGLAGTLVAHVLAKKENCKRGNGRRASENTSMQSIAVFSSSTTIASILRPRTTDIAVSYFLAIGWHRSTTLPLTPVFLERLVTLV